MTLDDARLFPIFEAIADSGACLMVHPWDMMGMKLMKKYWLPWLVSMPAETSLAICSFIFGGIFERLPNLRVMFAHAGGSFPATVGRGKHGYDCRPDLCARDNKVCPTDYMGKFWVDHLTHSEEQLGAVMNLIGSDRICFGTDYPFPLGECYPLKKPGELIYKKDGLTHIQKQQMLGQNTLEWLGVDSSKYLNNMDRENRLSEQIIMSKTHAELAGKYVCTSPENVNLTLEMEDAKFTWENTETGVTKEGKWEVGTYTRQGDVNKDVNLIFKQSDDNDGELKRPTLTRLNSEWSASKQLKLVLSDDGTSCKVVNEFKFENLKRCSGHNDMLEGEKRGGDESKTETLNAEREKLRKELQDAQKKFAEIERRISEETKTSPTLQRPKTTSGVENTTLEPPKLGGKPKTWNNVLDVDEVQKST